MTMVARESRLKTYASFTKLEHTVFSLPLIYGGALLHVRSWPTAEFAGWLLLAAIGARTAAMGLNRIIDARIDARNPRTHGRELPRGAMRAREAWLIVTFAGLLYLASAAALGPICLRLSPVPVLLFVVYPYLKRFTLFAHLGLGLAWSMGPLAGWLAAAQSLSRFEDIAWLWLFSVLWVTGFDIIYATMDEAFDREQRLHSLPATVGRRPALAVAALLHAAAFLALGLLWQTQLHPRSLWWLAAIGALFIWQHVIAERRPDLAFFQINSWIGFLVFGLILSGV